MQHINYRESRQRGTADFPMEYHHLSSTHPQYVMSLHWHVEFELMRILKGTFPLSIDENEFLVTEGSIVFISAGAVHGGIPENCEYECIVFDMNMLMNKNDFCCQFFRKIIDHEVEISPIFNDSCDNIHSILWNLFDTIASRPEGYQLIAFGALYSAFGNIYLQKNYSVIATDLKRNHRRIAQLKQALEFMESSYNHQITLQDMSDAVHMSPKYFCRFFQELTHRSPIDYLNYYRIERACYQLLTTNDTITEVAFSSGFNDLSYFIKTFKKYKGITPKKYLNA